MKLSIIAFLILASLGGSARAQDVNDFFSGNGSFELGPYVDPLTFSVDYSHGTSDEIPGWKMVAIGSRARWMEGPEAQDGSYYLQLNSLGGTTTQNASRAMITGTEISHTPFTIGEVYELVFWASGGVGTAGVNLLYVNMAGDFAAQGYYLPHYTQAEFDLQGGPQWAEYVIPFTAQVESPELKFTAMYDNSGGSTSLYLDNISFRPVPEPGSALLMLGAGGWLLGLGRRRRLGGGAL